MTTVILTKWGNSIGVRIPSAIIKEAHLEAGDQLSLVTNKRGELTLLPIKNQQAGWTQRFNAIEDAKDDESLIDFPNQFDDEDWTW